MLLRFTAPREAGLYQPPPPTSSEASTVPAVSAASGDTGTASGLAARAATGARAAVQARASVAWRMRRIPRRANVHDAAALGTTLARRGCTRKVPQGGGRRHGGHPSPLARGRRALDGV